MNKSQMPRENISCVVDELPDVTDPASIVFLFSYLSHTRKENIYNLKKWLTARKIGLRIYSIFALLTRWGHFKVRQQMISHVYCFGVLAVCHHSSAKQPQPTVLGKQKQNSQWVKNKKLKIKRRKTLILKIRKEKPCYHPLASFSP